MTNPQSGTCKYVYKGGKVCGQIQDYHSSAIHEFVESLPAEPVAEPAEPCGHELHRPECPNYGRVLVSDCAFCKSSEPAEPSAEPETQKDWYSDPTRSYYPAFKPIPAAPQPVAGEGPQVAGIKTEDYWIAACLHILLCPWSNCAICNRFRAEIEKEHPNVKAI